MNDYSFSNRSIQVENKTGCGELLKGDRDRLIEVKITVIKGKQIQDFDN